MHRICGCSDAAVCVQVNVSTAKWSLHLSAPLKQQQTRLPWMCSRLANFYAAGASFSGGTPHSFFCVMSRDILMKGGKVSNLHLHLHNCVHNVRFGWNVLHNSPIPAPTWVPLVARGFPSWSTCRSSKSYLFLDQSQKKRSLQPCKVPAYFWLNLAWGLIWLKSLPTNYCRVIQLSLVVLCWGPYAWGSCADVGRNGTGVLSSSLTALLKGGASFTSSD